MTQSGQGGEPSARIPREGVVLPSDGGAPLLPGEQAVVAPGRTWDQPWSPGPSAAQEPPTQHWDARGWDASQPPEQPRMPAQQQTPPAPPGAGPLPPEGARSPRPLPYGTESPAYGTQYEAQGHAAQGHAAQAYGTPPHAAEAATQYIPPVGPGALPPEMPAAPGPDAQATQYLPPVPAQQQPGAAPPQRTPPDVFDNLFRSEPGDAAAGPAQRPHPQAAGDGRGAQGPRPPHAAAGGRAAARRDTDRGRTGSRVPLIAAVGVGIAALGIGAGALLGSGDGGGGDGQKQSVDPAVAAAASDPASASPDTDPAKEQAVALDQLLADSGDSRESVINAVGDVKACKDLDRAAADLRDAAQQRSDLVTRLSELSVDKLPNHAELTAALTSAWKASESADNHYAAWADQAAGKKGCRKGEARTTGETRAGNKASATASAEKEKAAELWNAIAADHGLTRRQASQL
ncbi:hypothetical protein GCM10010145_01910 [Streptomyces ruber]|uniref:Uncharacterized protein n=2 Tax=Streptomyces TaxID=1883 RepID=A0A918B6V4_9ACTN|nr:hypothetical protein [Streptomyces ruber]GGQ38267.1 hypothetical protein GCM10010145_01910 [Streptomyces ruber]